MIRSPHPRKFRKRHWLALGALVLLAALIVARIYLPIWLKDHVNKQLNNIKGYRGSVEAIDVHLYRGAYTIRGLKLNKIDKGIPVPFLAIDTTDLSLQWGALFDGRIVSDVHLTRPVINFAKSANGMTAQTGKETDWTAPIRELNPIDINLLEIQQGRITYKDFSSHPQVDIAINDIHGSISNLRNVEDKNSPLPSQIHMRATSIGGGAMAVDGRLNALKEETDMDIIAKLENAKLEAFNSFSEAYAALRFKRGRMDLYSELIVKNGQISGYVKPIISDLSMDRIARDSNPLEMLWATSASFLIEVFSNQKRDTFATQVPLSGTLDNIETSFWPTLGGIVRNAFISAFEKGTDRELGVKGTTTRKESQSGKAKNPAASSPPTRDALVPNLGK